MTEPNKELPKEVVESITEAPYLFDPGDHRGQYLKHAKMGAQIALEYSQSHYAPIIEGKDKQLSEKDKRIAELEATIDFNNIHNATAIYMKDATISKLMGLLKERVWEDEYDSHYSIFNDEQDAQKSADKECAAFCKSHGIDLGGE